MVACTLFNVRVARSMGRSGLPPKRICVIDPVKLICFHTFSTEYGSIGNSDSTNERPVMDMLYSNVF